MAAKNLNRDISLTAVIPLWARAMEMYVGKSLFQDQLATQLWETDPFINSRRSIVTEADSVTKRFTQIEIAIRTQIIDTLVSHTIAEKPLSHFINIGSGLCTRASRLGLEGKFHETDSAAGLAFRNKVFGFKSKGESQLKLDLNEPVPIGYVRERTGNMPLTVICEGTLMYFKREKALEIIKSLIKLAGPKGKVIMEIMGSKGQGLVHPMVKKINPSLGYQWGEDSPQTLERLGVEVQSFFDVWNGYEDKWGPIAHLIKWWPKGRYSFGSFIVVINGSMIT